MADQDDGVRFLRSFGRQLRILREAAGLSRAELGARLGYGEDQITSIELGRRIARPEAIDRADEVLNTGGLLGVMKEEVEQARYPAFFRDAARLEGDAVERCCYAVHVVDGLLQTEGYVRALLRMRRPVLAEETIEQRVAARLDRQKVLTKTPLPLFSFVLEESVLRRRLGGAAVLRDQLRQIVEVGRLRNVEVQVMPLDREDNAGVDGEFLLITRNGGQHVGYVEAQGRSVLVNRREETAALAARYGIIRAQALTPHESLAFIESLMGDL
ncbi:helix-turn-helix transcriptional regulator [Yinghuangia aomiensis]|uniref:Helix-turn-helix transcriptional regulator n=1 Tax=Yinghuangia aomiensis TaxID=676205 RepID=A0ABP9GKC3_9ACTN